MSAACTDVVCLKIATHISATVQVLAESQGATTAVPFDQIDKVRAGSSGMVEFIMLLNPSAYSLQKATCRCVCGTCAQPATVARKHVTREGGGVVPPRFDFNSGPCPPPPQMCYTRLTVCDRALVCFVCVLLVLRVVCCRPLRKRHVESPSARRTVRMGVGVEVGSDMWNRMTVAV
jgi:hypothetical protein